MFRVRLLGTPHLESSKGVVLQGPRRLALLASLAASGPGGLTRDKLIARLWPEGDTDRSRRNLSQLLYAMRTELGADLVEGTGSVRLDLTTCSADVIDFDAAIAEKRWADAITIYGGPFLDGFHLAESTEFAQWADAERDRRASQARAASVRFAESVPTEDLAACAAAWRRALALDPLNAALTLRLMDSLETVKDRAGAIRIADQHAALLKSELDSPPDAAVQQRADALRRAPRATEPPTAPAAPTSPAAPFAADARPAGMVEHSAKESAGAAAESTAGSTTGRRRRGTLLAIAAVSVTVALLAWSLRRPAQLAENEFVLIAQFENETADTLLTRTLGAAMAAAIQQSAFVVPLPRGRVSAAMRRMGRPDTTEFLSLVLAREVAEREGVRFVIAGELLSVGSSRQFVARIIEAVSGRVMAVHALDVADDAALLTAVGDAARALRRDLGEARTSVRTAVPLPDVTTGSLAALHEYALALDAERNNRHTVAQALFERAVLLDPDFAAVHAKLAESYALNNDVPRATQHGGRALALVDGLPLAEQLRIRMSVAWARGDREEMVNYGRTYVSLRPRDFAAWARLGFTLFSAGQDEEARAAYATADRISPLSNGSILNWGTAWLSAARRAPSGALAREPFDSARYYYERAFRGDSALEYDAFFNHQYGTILLGAGLPDSARATFARMRRRTDLDRARALRSIGYLDAYQGDWSFVADHFAEAADVGARQSQWTTAVRNEALVAETHLVLGDRARAARPLARATSVALREQLEARIVAFVALAQLHAGDLAAARKLRDRMRALARPEHDAEQAALAFVDGAVELAAGNASLAEERIESGFRRDPGNLQGRILRARALEASGRDVAALEAWDAVAALFDFGVEGQFDWQFADAERGRLLERLGRLEEAATALRRLVARYPTRADSLDPPILRDARDRLLRLEGAKPPQ